MALVFLQPKQIIHFFTDHSKIQDLAFGPLLIIAFTFPLMAWSYSNAVYLRLIEKVNIDLACNILSLWFIQIPFSYMLGVMFGLGLSGFFIGFLLYDISYSLSTYYFVKKYMEK